MQNLALKRKAKCLKMAVYRTVPCVTNQLLQGGKKMRKRLLLPLLLFLLLNGVCQAQVDVYYLPDSGFLRVTGEVIIEPTNTSLSFLVFPMAQITEFWTDNLVDYSIQRGPNGTLVNFSIRQAHPQSLSFSYEGFLEPETRQIILGPDQLWFPEL